MNNVVLASTSQYRKKLLEQIGLKVKCIAPECDENQFKNSDAPPKELAKKLSELKLNSVKENYPNEVIIAGDQIAALGSEILSKPGNIKNATKQLLKLSGKVHKLFTAISVSHQSKTVTILNETTLHMRELTESQIHNYLTIDTPFDCAGSYKIEQMGITLFSKIESNDHTAIIGVPLMELVSLLDEFGINLLK